VSAHVTTHVLDAVTGAPAVGLELSLTHHTDSGLQTVATGVTDSDGRNGALGPERLDPGTYRLVFGTGAWFAAQGTPTFYPEVTIDFTVEAGRAHYHVPILLSPFAYSTYRGS
jgi:5-hydroxyisourate hydrolase